VLLFSVAASRCEDVLSYNLVAGKPYVQIVPASEHIGHTWSEGVVWDKPLIETFYRILAAHHEPWVAFDLGAQTGSFSLLAGFFPNSRWYAFEPIHEAAEILTHNLALNGIRHVSVQRCAVADFIGTTTLYMPPLNAWGLATLGASAERFDPVELRTVACITLDSFIADHAIERVDFMKLDIEGSELAALRGARALIERDHPIILMEYNEINMRQCGIHTEEVDSFLREMGYTWSLVSTEDILCVPVTRIYTEMGFPAY
jgi:FkbM family methyltransferase